MAKRTRGANDGFIQAAQRYFQEPPKTSAARIRDDLHAFAASLVPIDGESRENYDYIKYMTNVLLERLQPVKHRIEAVNGFDTLPPDKKIARYMANKEANAIAGAILILNRPLAVAHVNKTGRRVHSSANESLETDALISYAMDGINARGTKGDKEYILDAKNKGAKVPLVNVSSGMLYAIFSFDPAKGKTFSTYATWKMRGALTTMERYMHSHTFGSKHRVDGNKIVRKPPRDVARIDNALEMLDIIEARLKSKPEYAPLLLLFTEKMQNIHSGTPRAHKPLQQETKRLFREFLAENPDLADAAQVSEVIQTAQADSDKIPTWEARLKRQSTTPSTLLP